MALFLAFSIIFLFSKEKIKKEDVVAIRMIIIKMNMEKVANLDNVPPPGATIYCFPIKIA